MNIVEILESGLLALTDAQFDKILVMISEGFFAVKLGIQTVWAIFAPVLGLYLAYKCQQIIANQKSNRRALDENTKISEDAFVAANNFHAKADAIAAKLSTTTDAKD